MYDHPEIMRAEGNAHYEQLIAEASKERLAAQLRPSTVSLAQVREDVAAWLRPNRRRVAVKGI